MLYLIFNVHYCEKHTRVQCCITSLIMFLAENNKMNKVPVMLEIEFSWFGSNNIGIQYF